jgi:predicted dehydrogenase
MSNRRLHRRTFLATTTATGLLALRRDASGQAPPPSETIALAVIGPGGMGSNLLASFSSMKDVRVTHVCDVDSQRAEKAASAAEKNSGLRPKTESDLRKVLEDKSVDAVVVATPDHWHAPATILACDAGKHVYVEKPASHNIREGRLMVEAARRNKRVVQVGTQGRSTPHVIEAIKFVQSGAIGDVLVAKAWNSQRRANIGRQKPTDPPANVSYDQWVGPAPFLPFQSNRFHSWWRWWFNFGTGDIGNDGVHDLDVAKWGLGVDTTHPTSIAALGGKYHFDDDQQFPDTQYVVYEYASDGGSKKKQLVFEQRIWSPYVQEGLENGAAYYGTKGYVILSRHGAWQAFGERNKPITEGKGKVENTGHHRNFLDCIRAGGERRPNADIEIGHHSAALAHLGNIAARVARTLKFDPAKEQIESDPEANALVRREYREGHWAVPKGV